MRVCAGECWCWPRQEVLNPSELELQTLVSHVMWVLGKELRFSGRAASPFNLRDFSPAQDMARLLFLLLLSAELLEGQDLCLSFIFFTQHSAYLH